MFFSIFLLNKELIIFVSFVSDLNCILIKDSVCLLDDIILFLLLLTSFSIKLLLELDFLGLKFGVFSYSLPLISLNLYFSLNNKLL